MRLGRQEVRSTILLRDAPAVVRNARMDSTLARLGRFANNRRRLPLQSTSWAGLRISHLSPGCLADLTEGMQHSTIALR